MHIYIYIYIYIYIHILEACGSLQGDSSSREAVVMTVTEAVTCNRLYAKDVGGIFGTDRRKGEAVARMPTRHRNWLMPAERINGPVAFPSIVARAREYRNFHESGFSFCSGSRYSNDGACRFPHHLPRPVADRLEETYRRVARLGRTRKL